MFPAVLDGDAGKGYACSHPCQLKRKKYEYVVYAHGERIMNENIVVGCCGLPVGLERYAQLFQIVEVQQTFYKFVPEKTAEKWATTAHALNPNFEFTVKAHQFITHLSTSPTYVHSGVSIPEEKKNNYGFFKPTEEVFEAWRYTEKIARILGARIVLFQSPPTFNESDENIANLQNFFEQVSTKDFVFCWEPRGKWTDESVQKICQHLNLIHVVDPLKKNALTGKIFYFRLHGRSGYKYTYPEYELEKLAANVRSLEGDKTYIFFNNTNMLNDAQKMIKILSEKQ
jgi:uncharacterized protein YecE (DUF72 family)